MTTHSRAPWGPRCGFATKKPRAGDKYGRWLGRVLVVGLPPAPAWVDVGAELVRLKLAKPWDGKGAKPT